LREINEAIRHCISCRLNLPALILIYSTIDAIAGVESATGGRATRFSFVSWVNQYYWLGLTFHSCHQLEFGVKTVLVTMADMGFAGFDLSEMIAIIEDEKKKTLGQVLDVLRKRVTLSDGWAGSLAAGLGARNRFVHRFLSEVDDRVANPQTREAVIVEVKAIRRSVLAADRAVQQVLETLYRPARAQLAGPQVRAGRSYPRSQQAGGVRVSGRERCGLTSGCTRRPPVRMRVSGRG
jgi:hypothetical protein